MVNEVKKGKEVVGNDNIAKENTTVKRWDTAIEDVLDDDVGGENTYEKHQCSIGGYVHDEEVEGDNTKDKCSASTEEEVQNTGCFKNFGTSHWILFFVEP